MFAWKIAWELFWRSFSLKRDSLRFPSLKRGLAVLGAWSFLSVHLSLSWLFLLLDELLFPRYRLQELGRMAFILGKPRSGTSFFLQSLSADEEQVTTFRLWELVFAPSICQKKIWIFLYQIAGNVSEWLIRWLESFFFARMEGIHDLRWSSPEEDEFLFLYLFRSVYLWYLFPELEDRHDLLKANSEQRIKALRFYKKCVQRHRFVFDPECSKVFIAKNPTYYTMTEGLVLAFPQAKFLHLQRPLEQTAPSTFSLNKQLLSFFTKKRVEYPLRTETLDSLLAWEIEARRFVCQTVEAGSGWSIDFRDLIQQPSRVLRLVYAFLELPVKARQQWVWTEIDKRSKQYKSRHQYPDLTAREKQRINEVIQEENGPK